LKIIIDEEKSKVTVLPTKRSDLDSAFFHKLLPMYKTRPSLEDIDSELHPLITEMWNKGYKTLTCCSGHGKDYGFILYLPPRKRKWLASAWPPGQVPIKIDDLELYPNLANQAAKFDISLSKEELKRLMAAKKGIKYSR